ncbi:MAG TPA: hypothetical protein VMC07_01765 [Candidatus Omnitrophota bacterium]|nr:hypothetical protein [Candidatus Omnitrophota bacterium]
MNFIQKIFSKKTDNLVHLQFQKFSRGVFADRALVSAKKAGNKYTIFTGAEFANELVRMAAEKLGSGKTIVRGAIITTSDLTGKLDFYDKKQFQGVKSYLIEKEMSGNDILKLLNEFPKAFFGLSFSAGDTELKIKAKAPKSGKPKSSSDEKPKVDFCKIITTDEKTGKGFVWEKENFKRADFKHTFIIESIEVPEHLKKSEDFLLIREESRRKGKILREGEIDGEKVREEASFEA